MKRCDVCSVAEYLCICPWHTHLASELDIVLLMHRNEILKPTNTGRLISSLLPQSTYCFAWDRTEPDNALIELLNDPTRYPVILYPEFAEDSARTIHSDLQITTDKKLTLIVLDGTWKQARRMMNLSPYLAKLPALNLSSAPEGGNYGLRKANISGQVSTAEAVALALASFGDQTAAQALTDSFCVFNQHYQAAKQSKQIELTTAHQRLANLQAKNTVNKL